MAKKSGRQKGVIEVILPDGSMAMYIGQIVERTKTNVKLTDVSWIANTGRRHLFFSNMPDSNVEIEPYPDGVEVDLPAPFIVTSWPHPLPRQAK